ncbi:MAG: hypothetical protein M1818_001251 [Claussenomyces sp. TS43310]|nr:MAG: hypothetical protein M1818_001251 [Claussenomyces sp. TS43310]
MAFYSTPGVIISRLRGWVYVIFWSLSFYPQPILNFQLKSTEGFSIDFATLNVLGLISYAVANGMLLFSPTVRMQYAGRHPSSPEPSVRFNDFAYALHGAVMIYSQFWPVVWGFRSKQRTSHVTLWIFWSCFFLIFRSVIFVFLSHDIRIKFTWDWLDVVYTLGSLKIFLTIIKYIPQVWRNYQRRSTEGFSVAQIMLDFGGGCLSIVQLVIDSSLQTDWSGITGNPAKLALGNVTMLFDVIFLAQNFVLYRQDKSKNELPSDERDPLLE